MKARANSSLVIDQNGREVPGGSQPPRGAFEGGSQAYGFDFESLGLKRGPLTRAQRIARIEALATLLDVAFIIPGTKIRYGVDGLLRLIPVAGDLVATALSLWIVREARALGAPWHLTARMLGNVAVDGSVGLVPFAGDVFDVMFRANIRNIRMLRKWLDKQR